jgi:hypothetical protein
MTGGSAAATVPKADVTGNAAEPVRPRINETLASRLSRAYPTNGSTAPVAPVEAGSRNGAPPAAKRKRQARRASATVAGSPPSPPGGSPPVADSPTPAGSLPEAGSTRVADSTDVIVATPALSRRVVASAVYMSGTAGLHVGSRYLLAVDDAQLVIEGPVEEGPGLVALVRGLRRLEAAGLNDRLVVTEGTSGAPSTILIFMALAGGSADDAAVALEEAVERAKGGGA